MRPLKEIEYSFIGCIFSNPPLRILEALEEGAKKEWFSDCYCRLVWCAIESLRAKRTLEDVKYLHIIQEADRMTMKKHSEFSGLQIGVDFYEKAIEYRSKPEEGEKSDIHAYAEILRSGSIERRIKDAMSETTSDLAAADNTGAVASSLANRIVSILSDETTSKDINVSDLIDNLFNAYNTSYEEFAIKKNYDYVAGIPMPWASLSHITNGLQPGLHIVAARPSVGKTSYVLQCINFWCANGYKVVFNCLDMAVSQIIKRPLANLSRVAIDRSERGMTTPVEQSRLSASGAEIKDWYQSERFNLLTEYDVNQFKTWCTIRRAAGKLDIAVVDYAQQMRVRGSGSRSENDRLTQVSSVLKSIAVELGIPVIALSQLSRDNVKDKNGAREPTMADLRGSGSLEQDAFSITLLHKDDTVMKSWVEQPPMDMVDDSGDPEVDNRNLNALGAVWWIHCKNQNGETGRVPFVVYQNHYRWYVGARNNSLGSIPGRPSTFPKFDMLEADWRFDEEPFATIARNGKAIYPNYWPQKCARICAKMGKPLPDEIKIQLKKYDLDSYQQGIIEFNSKLNADKENSQVTIAPKSKIKINVDDSQFGSQGEEPETDEMEAVIEDARRQEMEAVSNYSDAPSSQPPSSSVSYSQPSQPAATYQFEEQPIDNSANTQPDSTTMIEPDPMDDFDIF